MTVWYLSILLKLYDLMYCIFSTDNKSVLFTFRLTNELQTPDIKSMEEGRQILTLRNKFGFGIQ